MAGLGQIMGAAIAALMLWVGNAEFSFVAMGAVLVMLAGFSIRSLRRADEHANIPVVEMALLSGLPMMVGVAIDRSRTSRAWCRDPRCA